MAQIRLSLTDLAIKELDKLAAEHWFDRSTMANTIIREYRTLVSTRQQAAQRGLGGVGSVEAPPAKPPRPKMPQPHRCDLRSRDIGPDSPAPDLSDPRIEFIDRDYQQPFVQLVRYYDEDASRIWWEYHHWPDDNRETSLQSLAVNPELYNCIERTAIEATR